MESQIVQQTKAHLTNVHKDGNPATEWSEGYISALLDVQNITEDEFDILIEWAQPLKED